MSLFQKACETYDYHQHLVGVYEEGKVPLAPIAHRTVKNKPITITIDSHSNFVDVVQSIDEVNYIIPVTVDSDIRSSNAGTISHPLSDKLKYFNPSNVGGFNALVAQLEGWCSSHHALPKIQAILEYIKRGTIIQDLTDSGIGLAEDTFVRWQVVGLGEDDISECWKDKELFQSWINYYSSVLQTSKYIDSGVCMISGDSHDIQLKHCGVIGKAKIISDKYDGEKDKDDSLVYSGRFVNGKEACTIGYTSSQKMHNIVRWEISRSLAIDGADKKKRYFLCWNPKGKKIPIVFNPLYLSDSKLNEPTDYYEKLKNTLLGYKNDLPATEDVIVVDIEATSKGRASITYYNEIKASDYLDRIANWYETCCWKHRIWGIQSPPIFKIVKAAFGREEKVKKTNENQRGHKLVLNEKVICDIFQELLNCVLLKKSFPSFVVEKLFHNASRPQNYTWEKTHDTLYENDVLFVACAVSRKYLNDKVRREEWSMELDKTKVERSYLFGRLLAVMEKVELDTFDEDEKREPNAIRMQSAFVEKPFACTKILHERLAPYFAKQTIGGRKFYKGMIGEIMEKLAEYSEQELNKPLKEPYLLGYYLQRNDLYKSRKADKEENENGSSAE